MKIPRKNEKEMLEIKNTLTEMKNALDGLISRLHMAEEKLSELENMTIETSETEKQREKRLGKETEHNIQEPWGSYKRCNLCVMGIPEKEREKGTEVIFEE